MINEEMQIDPNDADAGSHDELDDYAAESLKELGMYDTQDEGSDVPSQEADPADETTSGTTLQSSDKKEKHRAKSRTHLLSLQAIEAKQRAADLERQLEEEQASRKRAEAYAAELKRSREQAQPDEFGLDDSEGYDYGFGQESRRAKRRELTDDDIDRIVEEKLSQKVKAQDDVRVRAERDRAVQADIDRCLRASLTRIPNKALVPDIEDEIELTILEGRSNANIAQLLVGMKELPHAASVLHTLRKRPDFDKLHYTKLLPMAARLSAEFAAPKTQRSKASAQSTQIGTGSQKRSRSVSSYEEFVREENAKQKARRST